MNRMIDNAYGKPIENIHENPNIPIKWKQLKY